MDQGRGAERAREREREREKERERTGSTRPSQYTPIQRAIQGDVIKIRGTSNLSVVSPNV